LQEGERGDVARVVGVQSEDGLKLPVGAAAGAGMMEVPVCVCVHPLSGCLWNVWGTHMHNLYSQQLRNTYAHILYSHSSYVTHMHTFCTTTAAT